MLNSRSEESAQHLIDCNNTQMIMTSANGPPLLHGKDLDMVKLETDGGKTFLTLLGKTSIFT